VGNLRAPELEISSFLGMKYDIYIGDSSKTRQNKVQGEIKR
jgi:hypothetical protein